jgi:dienelactone hydrolase
MSDLKLGIVAVWAILLALGLSARTSSAENFRVLTPAGTSRHPAALLVSGCSGFIAINGVNLYEERAAELRAAGYVVVFVDYLGHRNLKNCSGQISSDQVGADILEAAAWTRARPDVDPARISVIGWSYGGGGIIAALMAMPPGVPAFTKAVMYYPDCRLARPWSAAGVSTLMHMGAIDEVAPAALCDAAVRGAPPNTVRVITYPNARHAFDLHSLPERIQYQFGTIGYNAEAAQASWATTVDFLEGRVAEDLAMASRQANAAEFPKTGQAHVFVYGTIHELLGVDGGSAGNIGVGDYTGVFGPGPFHDMSIRCVEGWTLIGGQRTLNGSCIWTDQDGDHILSTFGKGHNDLVSGSGKYSGITGSYTFRGNRLHEAPGGVVPVITQVDVTWEIK